MLEISGNTISSARWNALGGVLQESAALVVKMADSRQWQEWLQVPLYHAAATAQESMVANLLLAGAGATAGSFRDKRGSTLIHAAASGGSLDILAAFLEAGCEADVNVRESQSPRRTPLHCAIWAGHRDVARALMAAGADLETADVKGQTALHLAILRGHTGIVSDLLKLGLDTEVRDVDGNTPLALAVTMNTPLAIPPAGVAGESGSGSGSGKVSGGRDKRDDSGAPFNIAVKDNRLDCVRALLAVGADPEAVDQIGLTALLSATRTSNTSAIAALIQAGADVDGRGGTVWTPLHFAAHGGNTDAIEALVMRGGNLSARTSLKGSSPLHIAAGHVEARAVQELLLRWGADETALDARGQTPSDVAGHLKYVFDRGHRHEEEVEVIRTMLNTAPADRNWTRRRVMMMIVSREKSRISRERGRLESGAKKRGAQGGDGSVSSLGVGEIYCVGSIGTNNGMEVGEHEGVESLPREMAAVRDAVVRLAEMDDEGIFRSVVSFL